MSTRRDPFIVFATDRRASKESREAVLFNVAARFDGLADTVEAIGVDPKFRLYRMRTGI